MSASEQSPSVCRRGGISYLHIPTDDPARSATFYSAAFGWRVRDPESESPAFQDGTGHVIGHFIGEQPVAGDAGVRPYIYVDDVGEAVTRILASGGRVVNEPFAEGDLTVAICADPAGNFIGVWQFANDAKREPT